jgi:hypothetical protein
MHTGLKNMIHEDMLQWSAKWLKNIRTDITIGVTSAVVTG